MGTKERSDGVGDDLGEALRGEPTHQDDPGEIDDEAPTPIPGAVAGADPTQTDERTLEHDPREVRRRIAMTFSTGELSKFAERWRVFIDREGSVDDGARKLVRALAARGKLAQLVDSLRAHKPLIEWPKPTIEVEQPAPAASPPAEPEPEAPAPAAAPPTVGEPIVDPYEVSESSQDRPRGAVVIPKKWLIAGGSIAAGLLVGGLLLWASTERASSEQSASLALDASAELARSVAAVRSACKIDEEGDSARDQLTAAFRRCSVPSIRPSRIDVPLPPRPDPVPNPGPARPRRPAGPVSRAPVCLEQCHQIHNQCKKTQCGAEPTSAADYETYQRCLAGCLSQYSRCRLTCR